MPRTSANPVRRAAFAAAAAQVRGAAGSMFAREHDGDVVIGSTRLTKFYLRFHIALLILWSFCVGALTTKLLLLLGIDSMAVRYAFSLLVSYLAFFVGVRLWLGYVGADPLWGGRRSALRDNGSSGSSVDPFNWSGGSSGGSGGGSIRGAGGDFSGGGASSSFAGEARSTELAIGSPRLSPMPFAGGDSGLAGNPLSPSGDGALTASAGGGDWVKGSGSRSSSGGSSGIGLDLDLGDDGWLVVVLLILVAAVLASVFGVVLYLVWSGPALLADVAFQAMLAGGLIKSTRNWRDACWETRLLRATWIPFAIVLALAVAMAMVGTHLFPDAHTLGDMLRALGGRLG